MKINRASILRVEYFLSYFKLILGSRTSNLEEAKEILFQHIFKGNPNEHGNDTYKNFLKAYEQLKKEQIWK